MSSQTPRTWRFPRPIAEDWLFLSLIGWGSLLVVAIGIALGIDWFSTVTGSVWLPVSGAAPWFAAFVGGYVVHQMLPMFVANGRTRRDTAIELGMLGGVLVPALAALVTVGYLLEWGLYNAVSWPFGIIENRLFDTHSEVGLIFLDYLLMLFIWTAAGALIGGAYYRDSTLGLVSVVAAVLLAGFSGSVSGFSMGPGAVLSFLFDPPDRGVFVAVMVSAAAVAAASILAWLVVRDMPIRNR